MTRKSFGSHSEVCHVWAQQNQDEGKASRIFFKGEKIYSYGSHFCMARILPSGTVVYGTHRYSSSTGKHQSRVRSAVSHRTMVYCRDPDQSASRNREYAQSEIVSLLRDAESKPRIRQTTRDDLRLEAVRVGNQFNEYLAALPEKERNVQPIDLSTMGDLVQDAIAAEARRVQRAKDAEKQRIEQQKVHIAEWRQGVFHGQMYDLPTMLRLSPDKTEVQTSRGAAIPVSHAKRLWPLIVNVRAVKKPLTGRDFKLGFYTLSEIKENGDIVVGCHNIGFNEIEGIAHELGLTDTSEAKRAYDDLAGK